MGVPAEKQSKADSLISQLQMKKMQRVSKQNRLQLNKKCQRKQRTVFRSSKAQEAALPAEHWHTLKRAVVGGGCAKPVVYHG